VFKIGYIGMKRYFRVTITPANNTSASLLAMTATLGAARHQPAGATQVP
jgi:hypothetical protein